MKLHSSSRYPCAKYNAAKNVTIRVEKPEPGIYVAVVRKTNGEGKQLRFMKL